MDLAIGCCVADESNMAGFLQKGGIVDSELSLSETRRYGARRKGETTD